MDLNFLKADSIEELKSYGSLKEVRNEFEQLLGCEDIKFKMNTWENMYKSIRVIQKLLNINGGIKYSSDKEDDLYFKGTAEKYIYYLLELQGDERLKKLGVNKMHYVDKEIAAKWKKNIAKVIHPDNCHHIKAKEAMETLNKLYGEMIRR